MDGVDRRSALSLGLVGALAPLLASSGPARAQTNEDWVPNYSPTEGQELSPGRRLYEVGTQPSYMSAYSSIQVIDVVFEPGAADPPDGGPMDMDMMCFIIAGSFRIEKDGFEPFEVKAGDFYSCGIGTKEIATNIGDTVGIHRIALLMPA
jgi:hypothetical protein